MKPNMPLSRAEEMLAGFTDLAGLSDEEIIVMGLLVELGIFKGYGDDTLRPDAVLQRVHMASLAVRLQDLILGK